MKKRKPSIQDLGSCGHQDGYTPQATYSLY